MEHDRKRLMQALYRGNFSAFIRKCFHTVSPGDVYLHNWHIDLMADWLERMRRHEVLRLIFNIPPGYLKSITFNVAWPAFLLGHDPTERIMSLSFAGPLALKHAVDCRVVLESEWYQELFPATILNNKDQNQKVLYQTTALGHRHSVSTEGTVTGFGCGRMIIDDPQKPDQARNVEVLESKNSIYDQTLRSRLRDKQKGTIALIQQRLNPRDMTGFLKEEEGLIEDGGLWHHVKLPMEAEKKEIWDIGGTIITREIGELIHPERENKEDIESLKRDSYTWSGQYQQEPIPQKGGMIPLTWFKRYDVRPAKFDLIGISTDTAAKDREVNDPTAMIVWGEVGNDIYILDVLQERLRYPALKRTVVSMLMKWKPNFILIEDKSTGEALIPELRDSKFQIENSIPRGLSVIGVSPVGNKIIRLSTESHSIQAGRVWLPNHAPWLPAFELEISRFPMSATKDQVDALSQLLKHNREHSRLSGVIGTAGQSRFQRKRYGRR